MNLRNHVNFESDLPDDAAWDDSDNLIVPGGRSVATHIHSELSRQGYSCTSVLQHSFYGWEFTAGNSVISLWCLLQSGGRGEQSWLLLFEQRRSLLGRVFGENDDTAVREFANVIQSLLTNSAHFSNVRWYSKSEYEGGPATQGMPSPE
jgi:hypothetical protein